MKQDVIYTLAKMRKGTDEPKQYGTKYNKFGQAIKPKGSILDEESKSILAQFDQEYKQMK